MALTPSFGGMTHHGQNSVVILLVLVVQEHQLGPQVGVLSSAQNLWKKKKVNKKMSKTSESGFGQDIVNLVIWTSVCGSG